ncbi:MAG: hypothetical protein ACTHOJ_15655 [Sphingomonas oligoaromativorans]
MRAIPLLFLVAGCAGDPRPCPPSQVKVEAVPQLVPVPTRCIDKADVPLEPGPVTKTGDARNDLDFAGAKISELRKWGRSLIAMMGPCER